MPRCREEKGKSGDFIGQGPFELSECGIYLPYLKVGIYVGGR